MISVIIPIIDQKEMTLACIDSVEAHTDDYEIIIVDNGSEPRWFNRKLAYIRNEENLGFPVAVNQGIRAAKGENIILLNNDVIVTPGWADRLIKWLDEYDFIGPCRDFVNQKNLA